MPAEIIWQVIGLTFLAGLSTGVGAILTVFLPRSQALLGLGMGFSALRP